MGFFLCLCLGAVLPARAEGEYWVSTYNQLATMLNERSAAAGAAGYVPLIPEGMAILQSWPTSLEDPASGSFGLNKLRGIVISLARNHYVRHLDSAGSPVDYDGKPSLHMWIEDGAGTDPWGNTVQNVDSLFDAGGKSYTFFDMIRSTGPGALQTSVGFDPNATTPHEGRNAFCRIPPSYGRASYSNQTGWNELYAGPNNYLHTPVLWEHFQEIYNAIQLLQWTKSQAADWQTTPGQAKGAGASGSTCPQAQTAAAGYYANVTAWPSTQSPFCNLDAIHVKYRDDQGQLGQYYDVGLQRAYGYYTVALPSALSCFVQFYAYCPPAASGNIWHDNGDAVLPGLWARWDDCSEAAPHGATATAAPLGDASLPGPALLASGEEPVAPDPPPDPYAMTYAHVSKGYWVTDTCAIIQWIFTPWAGETDFSPEPDSDENEVIVGCSDCSQGGMTCPLNANVAPSARGHGGAPDLGFDLAISSHLYEPQVRAAIRTSLSRFPLSGLTLDPSTAGVNLMYTLDMRQTFRGAMSTEYTDPVTHQTETYYQSFANILRPTGRIVTFRQTDKPHVRAVGSDAGRAYELVWNSGDLVFPESSSHETYGTAAGYVNAERVSATGDHDWPGIDMVQQDALWKGICGIWHNVEFVRDPAKGNRVVEIILRAPGDPDPAVGDALLRYTLAFGDPKGVLQNYVGPDVTSLVKSVNTAPPGTGPNWQQIDRADFHLDEDERWHMARGGTETWVEIQPIANSPDVRILRYARQGEGPARVESWRYSPAPWGWNAIEHAAYDPADPPEGVAAEAVEYFTDPVADGPAYGKVKRRLRPDGGWERFTYNADGYAATRVAAWLDAPPDADPGLARETTYGYTPVDPLQTDNGSIKWWEARTIVEKTLGIETARTWRIIRPYEEWTIRAAYPGAPLDDPANARTIVYRQPTGDFTGRLLRIVHTGGTESTYSYSIANGQLTSSSDTGVTGDGTRSVTVTDEAGRTLSSATYDVATSALLSSTVHSEPDRFGRLTRTDYLDGTFTATVYGCCGPETVTDRDGMVTSYAYDDLKRTIYEARAGIASHYAYDVEGNVTQTVREGTDHSEIVTSQSVYDEAGRLVQSIGPDPDGEGPLEAPVTVYTEGFSTGGGRVRTTTNPDGSTRVETHARDGQLLEVGGTSSQPVRYEHGAEEVLWNDAAPRPAQYTKTIRVGEAEAETEWTKSYADALGRTFLTVQADAAAARSYYNDLGQLWKSVDPDGVTALYAYNAKGEQEYSAVDIDQDDEIDFAGPDRISRSQSGVTQRGAVTVRRSTSSVWTDTGEQVVSIQDSAVGADESWSESFGRVSHTVTAIDAENRTRTTTSTAPDGTYTVTNYEDGQLASVTGYDAADTQIVQTAYAYDAHGRQAQATETGVPPSGGRVTTYAYDNADRVVSTAVAGDGLSQTTSFAYDIMGRRTATTLPDGAVQRSVYDERGQVVKAYGGREYPVEYEYDPQGRMAGLTTWKDFDEETGTGVADPATTTWAFDAQRGWLAEKLYADSQGPSYTYNDSGRLAEREWARGVTTGYTYDAAGNLTGTDYGDATPDVTYTYTRRGQIASVSDGSGTRVMAYGASGQILSETYTDGPLEGIVVTRTYDALDRLASITVTNGAVSASEALYTYDDAGRLATVNDGANTFTYSYVAGQPGLVASIAANNGTTDVMTTTKTYDTLQRLVSISNSANTQTVSSHAYQYNTANQRTRATLADGSYWEYSYDSLGQVIGGVKKTAAGVPIPGFAFGYSFDHIGNRIDASENSAQSEYTSNALNQYTERTVPGVAHIRGSADEQAIVTVTPQGGLPEPVTRQGERFYKGLTFDNSTAPVEAEVTVTGVRPGLGPNGEDVVSEETRPVRIPQAPEEFAYDADGNLIGDGTWTCTWDAENRLISTSRADNVKVTYAYDSQSRRIRKTAFAWDGQAEEWVETSDTLYVWQDWLLLAEIDATSGDPVRTHLWGLDLSGSLQGAGGVGGLLCSTTCDPQPMTYVAAYDGNGNIMACLHASDGSLAAWFEYSPFGETLVASGSAVAGLPFRFSTRFTDPETGLVYYGHRYYNAGMGRWMSRDPIGEQDVANSYVSCVNAPILRRDYLGLASNWQVQSLLRDSLIHYRSLVDQPFVGGSLGFRWLAGMLAIEIGHIRESRQDGLGSGAAGIPIAALYRGGNPSRITIGTGFSPSNDWPYVIHELTHARNDRWLTPRGVDLSTPTGDRVDEGSAYAVEFLARAAVHLAEVEALLRGRSNCSDIEARLETPTNRWSRAWTTLVNPTLPDATEAYTNDGRSFSLTIWDFGYARRNHGICLPCGSVRDHYNGLLRAKGCSERLCFTCDTDSDPKAPIGVFNLAVPPYLD